MKIIKQILKSIKQFLEGKPDNELEYQNHNVIGTIDLNNIKSNQEWKDAVKALISLLLYIDNDNAISVYFDGVAVQWLEDYCYLPVPSWTYYRIVRQ